MTSPASPLRRAQLVFQNDAHKLAFMRETARGSARAPDIVELASRLVHALRPDDWIDQVRMIHRWVRDGVRYQHDPDHHEQLADASAVAHKGFDDCDGKAVLFVALCRAVGIDAEVLPLWQGVVLRHVQGGTRFPGHERCGVHRDGWLLSELTVRDCEPGQDPFTIARNPETGRLPLA